VFRALFGSAKILSFFPFPEGRLQDC